MQKLSSVWEVVSFVGSRAGIWLLSVMLTVGAPCLPLLIELLKGGSVSPGNIYITAAVMAAVYASSVEHVMFFVLYLGLFVVNLILDTVSGPYSKALEPWAGTLLLLVALLHMTERAWWHAVLNRPFPERFRLHK
jgi:hypothetical protein